MDDLISRRGAIDALWKALFEYEEKTEKQFLESDELDLSDWMIHRIFVQDMSDIDRETILNLPSVQPDIIRCKGCKHWVKTVGDDRWSLGDCSFLEKHLVMCNGICAWAERKEDGITSTSLKERL